MGFEIDRPIIIGRRKPCWIDEDVDIVKRRDGFLVSWISASSQSNSHRSFYWKIFDNLGNLQFESEESLQFSADKSRTVEISEGRTLIILSKNNYMEGFTIGAEGEKEINSTLTSQKPLNDISYPQLVYSSGNAWVINVGKLGFYYIYTSIFDMETMAKKANFTVTKLKSDNPAPTSAKLDNGNVLIAWLNQSDPNQYVAKIYDPNGTRTLHTFPINKLHPEHAKLNHGSGTFTISPTNYGFIAAWNGFPPKYTTKSYQVQRFHLNGSLLENEFTLEQFPIGNIGDRRIKAISFENRSFFAWQFRGVIYGKSILFHRAGFSISKSHILNQRNLAIGENVRFNLLPLPEEKFVMTWFGGYSVFMKQFAINSLYELPEALDDPNSLVEQAITSEFYKCIQYGPTPTLIKRDNDVFIGWRSNQRRAVGKSLNANSTGNIELGPLTPLQKNSVSIDDYFSISHFVSDHSVFLWTQPIGRAGSANITHSIFDENNSNVNEMMLSHTPETFYREDGRTGIFSFEDSRNITAIWNCVGNHGGALCSHTLDENGFASNPSVIIDDQMKKYLIVGGVRLNSKNIAVAAIEEEGTNHPIHLMILDREGRSLLNQFHHSSDGFGMFDRISLSPLTSQNIFFIFSEKSQPNNSTSEVFGRGYFENGTAIDKRFLIDSGNVGSPFAIPFQDGLFLTWRNQDQIIGQILSGTMNIQRSPIIPISLTKGASFTRPNALMIDETRSLIAWHGSAGIVARVLNLSLLREEPLTSMTFENTMDTMSGFTSKTPFATHNTFPTTDLTTTHIFSDLTSNIQLASPTSSGALIGVIVTVVVVACGTLLGGLYYFSRRKRRTQSEQELQQFPAPNPSTSQYDKIQIKQQEYSHYAKHLPKHPERTKDDYTLINVVEQEHAVYAESKVKEGHKHYNKIREE